MKKGISIWSFATNTLREAFALAKKAGFDGVEVALAEDGEINLDTSVKDLNQIKQTAADAGIALYSVASGLYWKYSLTSDNVKHVEKAKSIVKKQLETAEVLGCDTILVIPGAVSVIFAPELGIVPYDDAYKRSFDALKELAPYAEKSKVTIGLENVWNNFLLSPLEMKNFIDSIGSNYVKSYFDVGNVLYSGFPEQWIKILGERIAKVHFKDYRNGVAGLNAFVDLLAGDVDWAAVMAAFKSIGYDGWVTGEMLPPYKQFPATIIYNTSNAMDKILGRKQGW
ncbi:hexulose-6-phosphate isomerase [Spirochaetia bacterium]|nr:hexulose-6-phosphate isomerase [Spirochaetia bacterium]